ncbi:MAG: hypothetical protein P8M04_10890 [Akkermansiaceae bacterium]|jgi:hypothetical protein|nr:hypothetical protein [Akkermansiaceae bacterium]
MDKKRAKFILKSFRSDAEDSTEPIFAEALELAAKDHELGEWLAAEHAEDATFASILSDVKIPEELRDAIFRVLEGAQEHSAEFDADFVEALALIRPPKDFRDQILQAISVEQNTMEISKRRKRRFFKTALWAVSAMAVIAIMFGVGAFFAGAGGNTLAGTTPREVEDSAIAMLQSPFFSFDLQNDRQAALYEWLDGKDLPIPVQLPEGLKVARGVGCKFLEIGEEKHRGSLICYKKSEEVIYLVMMELKAIDTNEIGEFEAAVGMCRNCDKNDEWAVTQWADSEHAYFLLSKIEPSELADAL